MRWYLIHTKPTREVAAEVNLQRQGYQVYYPRLLRPTLVNGRWIDRVASLFPRYLFLRLAVGRQAMGPVRSTVGVANIVRFGLTTPWCRIRSSRICAYSPILKRVCTTYVAARLLSRARMCESLPVYSTA